MRGELTARSPCLYLVAEDPVVFRFTSWSREYFRRCPGSPVVISIAVLLFAAAPSVPRRRGELARFICAQ